MKKYVNLFMHLFFQFHITLFISTFPLCFATSKIAGSPFHNENGL